MISGKVGSVLEARIELEFYGSVVVLPVFLGAVAWQGRQRGVGVPRVEGTPLVGMGLLRGSRLMVDVVPDGTVSIEALP
jgi:hypothetical protein